MDSNTEEVELPEARKEEPLAKGVPSPQELTVGVIQDRRRAASEAIFKPKQEYSMNRAFLGLSQWLKWSKTDTAYVPWRRPNGESQLTVDKMGSLVDQIVSKLMKDDMIFEVPAASADDYAIEGSLLAQSLLMAKRVSASWETKREELFVATLTGGTAAVVTDWNGTAKAYGAYSAGDTRETVLPITEFALEPAAKSVEDARWWVKEQVMPAAQAQAVYNLAKKPRADYGSGGMFAGGLMGHSGNARGCLVTTYYERPNALRPEGAIAVVINDQFAWGPKPWPFAFKDRLNIEVARDKVIPGQWYGEARLSAARKIQIQYNFVHSNIAEHIKKVGTAKFVAPMGASEVFDQMSDNPAEGIRYPDSANPPHYLQAPNMPPYIINMLDRLEAEMQDILGIHGISQGKAQGRVDSGYGLSLLAEQDATPAGRLAKEGARVWANIASNHLEEVAAKVKETREATVYEPRKDIAHVVKWCGKDLAGQTRAIIPPDSILPRSRAQMQMWAETLAKMGFIQPDDPDGLTKLLEIAQVPGRDDALAYTNPQEYRARRDIERMVEGEVVIPRDFHNHKNAISVANRFRNSGRYEALSKKMQEVVDKYCLAHERMDQEEAGGEVGKAALSPALQNAASAHEPAPLPPGFAGLPPEAPQLEAGALGAPPAGLPAMPGTPGSLPLPPPAGLPA